MLAVVFVLTFYSEFTDISRKSALSNDSSDSNDNEDATVHESNSDVIMSSEWRQGKT